MKKTTLEDLAFAEQYLDYVSRKSTPEVRARARILLATIEMLDVKHPEWRTDLLQKLDEADAHPDVAAIFPLPDIDGDAMFKEFMSQVMRSHSK